MRKEKPWEASIPKSRSWTMPFKAPKGYHFLQYDKNPKNVVIDLLDVKFDETINWIKENKLKLCNWEEIHFVDRWYTKYIFRFKTAEDALAFKLRWLLK